MNKAHDNAVSTRIAWIDYYKGLAIIGVVTIHLLGAFLGIPKNNIVIETIRCSTTFDVSLFIFLGGVASHISLTRKSDFSGGVFA